MHENKSSECFFKDAMCTIGCQWGVHAKVLKLTTVYHFAYIHSYIAHDSLMPYLTPTPGSPLPVVRQQVKMCPWKITLLMETSVSVTLSKNQKKIDYKYY